MEFFRRAAGKTSRLGILAGTFNPPTRAHLALARAALAQVEEVLFILPRLFPHKTYEGAGFAERVKLLEVALQNEPRFSIAATEGGLFIEIARECRSAYGGEAKLYFVCGRDAAERVVNWDYGKPGAFLAQLREFQLLVAARKGEYEPPAEMRTRIHKLTVPGDYDEISASDVRERIARRERWEHLVPESIVSLARELYVDWLSR